jgi:CRP-like cAMP-binding protein
VLAATGIVVAVAGLAGARMAAPAARRRAGSPVDVRVARLAALPLFAGVPAATLEAVAARLAPVRVAAGEVVVRQGDAADRFYVIEEGAFAVTRVPGPGAIPGGPVPRPVATGAEPTPDHLRTMGPGEVFGEIGLLRGVPRTATVTAETDGALLALDGSDFLGLVSAGPLVGPRLADLRRGAPGAGY